MAEKQQNSEGQELGMEELVKIANSLKGSREFATQGCGDSNTRKEWCTYKYTSRRWRKSRGGVSGLT